MRSLVSYLVEWSTNPGSSSKGLPAAGASLAAICRMKIFRLFSEVIRARTVTSTVGGLHMRLLTLAGHGDREDPGLKDPNSDFSWVTRITTNV